MSWVDGKGYTKLRLDGKVVFFHRLVWEMANGKIPSGMMVDHINGNVQDNHFSNLRLATRAENGRNRVVKPMTNIRKRVGKNKWEVRFMYHGKELWLGLFNTLEEAQKVRDSKRIELYGEFNGRKEER